MSSSAALAPNSSNKPLPVAFGPMLTCSGPGSSSGFKDIAEREAGFQAGYAGQAGELVLMEAPVIINAGDADDEHVIVLAGHEVTGGDTLGFAHGRLKGGEDWSRLALERDADEDGHVLAEQPIVDLGAVSADGAGGFKGLDATRCGRSRQTGGLANFVVGGPSVAFQVVENGLVQLIQSELAAARRVFWC
jgi:hypothetical protein